MRCQYCHNPDTWELHARTKADANGNMASSSAETLSPGTSTGVASAMRASNGAGTWTAAELIEEVLRYKNFIKTGGVTCSGGEPLMQAEFVEEFFKLCHAEGIHTCLDTSGVFFNDNVKRALQHTDLVMLDIKTLDEELHPILTGHNRQHNQQFLDFLEETGKTFWIRHVVVPGLTDDDERLMALAKYLKRYKHLACVEILAYHTMGEVKYEKLNIPYPLKGVPNLSRERAAEIREMFKRELNCKVQ